MKIDFSTIYDHIIPLSEFCLNWRFTEQHEIPAIHLEQLIPLDKQAAKFLWDFTMNTQLFKDIPFKKDFFRTIDKAKIEIGNETEIKKWLYQRGFPFEKPVFLSWDMQAAMIVPWKMLVKYHDAFYYPASDDLVVIDSSLTWALLFYHEDELYFGTNHDYQKGEQFDGLDFIW